MRGATEEEEDPPLRAVVCDLYFSSTGSQVMTNERLNSHPVKASAADHANAFDASLGRDVSSISHKMSSPGFIRVMTVKLLLSTVHFFVYTPLKQYVHCIL